MRDVAFWSSPAYHCHLQSVSTFFSHIITLDHCCCIVPLLIILLTVGTYIYAYMYPARPWGSLSCAVVHYTSIQNDVTTDTRGDVQVINRKTLFLWGRSRPNVTQCATNKKWVHIYLRIIHYLLYFLHDTRNDANFNSVHCRTATQ